MISEGSSDTEDWSSLMMLKIQLYLYRSNLQFKIY